MQEVTCPQCENIVHITPDSPLCSICGTDLDDLVSPEYAASYFYKRASDMATSGRKQESLTEVNRGLTYSDTSDLRLLGAILANQLGDFGQMRSHVAAIPVDDVLREEGEWILRSHQAKRRAQRTSTKSAQHTSDSVLPFPINGENSEPTGKKSKARNPWPVLFAILIVTVLALIWMIGIPGTRSDETGEQAADATILAASADGETRNSNDMEEVAGAEVGVGETDQPDGEAMPDGQNSASTEVEPTLPSDSGESAEGVNPADVAPETSGEETLLPSPAPLPTDPPTPTVEPTPEEISTDGPVDVIAFLAESGYAGLTDLDIEGEMVDGVLRLTGEVPMMEVLDVLVSAVSSMPNAQSIDTENVVLTPPETYTVRPGDNLWIISVRVYGDTEHMNDIFRENRDILPSPEILNVGTEIKLPPYNPQ